MFKKLLMLALTSGLAAKALSAWIDSRKAPRTVQRADLQRWEDEGGNPAPEGAAGAGRSTKSRATARRTKQAAAATSEARPRTRRTRVDTAGA